MAEVGFRLRRINTEQFAIIESCYDKDRNETNIKTDVSFGIEENSTAIIVTLKIEFIQKNCPFILLEASCEFDIEETTWNDFIHEKEICIPKKLITHLAVIATGTCRGILHAKTENTHYNSFFLPTINLTQIITSDAKFPI